MDIKCRIGQIKQVFMDMRSVLCARKLGLGVRKRLLRCCIWSVLLHMWVRVMDYEQEYGKKDLRRQKCGSGERC